MKKIIGISILFGQCIKAFFSNIKNITTKKDCFWTINETFFIGENAKIRRDNFQKEYNELVIFHIKQKPIGNSKPMKKLNLGSTDWVGSNTQPSIKLEVK